MNEISLKHPFDVNLYKCDVKDKKIIVKNELLTLRVNIQIARCIGYILFSVNKCFMVIGGLFLLSQKSVEIIMNSKILNANFCNVQIKWTQ